MSQPSGIKTWLKRIGWGILALLGLLLLLLVLTVGYDVLFGPEVAEVANVTYAFLTEENYDEPGAAGTAWQQTLAFLAANLQLTP